MSETTVNNANAWMKFSSKTASILFDFQSYMPEIPYGSFLTPNEVFTESLSLRNN